MYLKIKHEIDNNVFITDISVESLGTEQLRPEDEEELLNDFPIFLEYRNLTFAKNVKVTDNITVVTDDPVGEGVVQVVLPPLTNKEVRIDKDFALSYKCDTGKITSAAMDENVLTTKELVAQARCAVFDSVICEDITDKLNDIRVKAPAFISEESIII